jgi:serine/threonine-protein kinase
MKKSVAIKRILPTLTKNKKFVSMFLDEARVSMQLQHANVVGVFDIGMADTAYFIVMEYVDGANLKTILESLRRQGKRLPVSQTLYIMMEVCKGLQYAHDVVDPENGHALGIVHRDISPPNILISKRGEVKLVDFGLAKATSQLESTDPGVVKGKFSYLSPEAASGKEVDRRADIFAVGILLYELLTGKRLFYGETDYQTVELVRQAKVPPIAQQNPDVQPELEQIIRHSLARDVGARFQNAGDLQDALAQHLFSTRQKVTNRDIEQLVQVCLQEKARSQPKASAPMGSLIDELINEEMLKFTSLDEIGESEQSPSPNSPSPAGSSGNAPLDPGSFIDTRGWVEDLSTDPKAQSPHAARNGAGQPRGRRDSSSDVPGLEALLEGDGGTPRPQKTPQPPQPISNKPAPKTATSSSRLEALRSSNKRPAPSPSPSPSIDPATGATPIVPPMRKSGSGGRLVAVVVVLLLLAGFGIVAVYYLRTSSSPKAPPAAPALNP